MLPLLSSNSRGQGESDATGEAGKTCKRLQQQQKRSGLAAWLETLGQSGDPAGGVWCSLALHALLKLPTLTGEYCAL